MTNSRELFICALLFLLKNIYLGGPGRYPFPYRAPSLLLAGCGLRAWYLRHSAAKWSLLSTSSIKLVSSSNDKFKGTLYLCPTLSSKEYISWRPGALLTPLSPVFRPARPCLALSGILTVHFNDIALSGIIL